MRNSYHFLPALFCLLILSCVPDEDRVIPAPAPSGPPTTLAEYLAADGNFTIFSAALVRTGLDQDSTGGRIQLAFAPTDVAFADSGVDPAHLSDAELYDLVSYHLSAGNSGVGPPSTREPFTQVVYTRHRGGPDSTNLAAVVNWRNDIYTVNGAQATGIGDVHDQPAGQVLFIDHVLVPPTLQTLLADLPQLREFNRAVESTPDLYERLGDLSRETTVFALEEADPAELAAWTGTNIQRLLGTHMLEGNVVWRDLFSDSGVTLSAGQTLNFTPRDYSVTISYFQDPRDARVQIRDGGIQTRNGVLYVVDRLILPVER